MKKLIALCSALVLVLSMVGCEANESLSESTLHFHDKILNAADLSQETIKWFEWYNVLSETEQLSVSYIPADLYELCGYLSAEDTVTVDTDSQ